MKADRQVIEDLLEDKRYSGVIIFIVTVAVVLQRLLLNLYFFSLYGRHSCYVPELWFYKGVGAGLFKLSVFDPTLWLMKFSHKVFGINDYYAIIGSGVFLILLSGLLLYLLVKKLYNTKTGLVVFILYLSLYAPIEWNIASFTHDLVQLPVFLAVLLLFVHSREKPGLFLFALPLFILGIFIGPMIFVALLIIVFFLLAQLIRKMLLKDKLLSAGNYLVYLSVLLLTLFVLKTVLAPYLLTIIEKAAFGLRGINLSVQIYHGSKDLLPVTLNILFENFKYLWVFIALGFFAAYRKRDMFTPILFLVPLFVALMFTRGIRFLDIGGVVLAGCAFSEWLNDRRARKAAPVIFIIVFSFCVYQSHCAPFVIEAAVFCLLLLGIMYLTLSFNWLRRYLMVVILSLIFFVNTFYSYSFIKEKITISVTEAEYNTAQYLRENSKDKNSLLLVDWDLGYPFSVISGHDVFSSPEKLTRDTGNIFWMDLSKAKERLRKENIKYIIISTKEFYIISIDVENDTVVYATGLSNRPSIRRLADLEKTLIYNLIVLEDTSTLSAAGINLIYEETDRYMKHRVRLFELS